jgi:putative ABC transport system substrate-binding protein
MHRRRFLISPMVLPGVAATSHARQQDSRIRRIGFLGAAHASGYARELEWIRAGLADRGYAEGRNLVVDYRWAEGSPARLRPFAAEFVALKVDAIVTHALPGTLAAAAETATIPIVMADGGDPVAAGLAATLARPGGNVTGSFSFTLDEIGKRLELLKEVLPRMRRLAFLSGPSDTAVADKRQALRAAAEAMNVEVREFPISHPSQVREAFGAMAKAGIEAVLPNNEPFLNSHAVAVAASATAFRLPSVGYASYADAGGLIAYGANRPALYRRVGYFLERIFNGTKAGDIPFERAAKFDVIVNRQTAKALAIEIPRSLLLRADRLIE